MFGESMTKGTLIEVKVDTPQETIDYLEQIEGATVVIEGLDLSKRIQFYNNQGYDMSEIEFKRDLGFYEEAMKMIIERKFKKSGK